MTYTVGFAARPIGALVFGHYGDRLGRKKLLVLSLLMMGGATFAIGLLPTHAAVGTAAPVLPTTLRLVQGFRTGRRVGRLGAAGVGHTATPGGADSGRPGHKPAHPQGSCWPPVVERMPLVAVLKHRWRDVLIAMGARTAENISYYVITAFVLVYATSHNGLSQQTALNAVLIASALHFAVIPAWGALSDRIGRRPVYLLGAVGVAGWAFPFFALVDSDQFELLLLAVSVGLVFHGAMYAPQAAFLAEMFATRMRYSGASIGAQFASVAAGAPALLIATALLAEYHSPTPIALYVIAAGTVRRSLRYRGT